MALPPDIQTKVISHLQYIQDSLDKQQELNEFFSFVSPTLRDEVKGFIFHGALQSNSIFCNSINVMTNIIQCIELKMYQPDEDIIR